MPTPKVLILTGDAAESLEVMYPYQRLKEEGYKDCVGTQVFSTNCWHRRTNAEGSSFIGGSTNDRTVSAPSDDYGPAAKLRIVALLDGRVEGVHVHVNDFS